MLCVFQLRIYCFEELNLRELHSALYGLDIKLILLLLKGKVFSLNKVNQLKTSQNDVSRQTGVAPIIRWLGFIHELGQLWLYIVSCQVMPFNLNFSASLMTPQCPEDVNYKY
jgi:hypothetical protein